MSDRRVRLAELADACGVSVSTVSGWKTAKWQPKGEAIERLARFFGVSVGYLLYGKPKGSREISMQVQEGQSQYAEDPPVRIITVPAMLNEEPERGDIERLISHYLDHAEKVPGGIAFAWHKLRKACDPEDFQ